MPVWDFSVTGSVPTEFTSVTGGNGSVSVTGGKLVCNKNGTATTDYAGLVYKTAMDMSKLTIIAVEVDASGGNVGAFAIPLIALIDNSGEPGAMSNTNWNSKMRVRWENQLSSSDAFDRWMCKFKNPSDTQYHWSYSLGTWTTTFNQDNYSIPDGDQGQKYLLTYILDGTVSPKRWRATVHGYYNKGAATTSDGRQLYWDTTWVNFSTGTTDIDEVDNSLWLVLADIVNDAGTDNIAHNYSKVLIGEINASNPAHFAWTNRAPDSGYVYKIDPWVNPFPSQTSLWTKRLRHGTAQISEAQVTGSTEKWVKDPRVYNDVQHTGYYYMVLSVKKTTDDKSYIWIGRSTSLLNPSWGNWTQISAPGAGENHHNFPYLTRAPGAGTWYLFYGVEKASPPPLAAIQYKTSANSAPESGWSTATTLLDTAGSTVFDDDGCSQPFPIWVSGTFTGGTWLLYYAGYDGTHWKSHWAKSTTGIVGTYTKAAGGPKLDVVQWNTTLSSNAFDTNVVSVGSTTGISAGDVIMIGGNPKRIAHINSVDSGTQLTLNTQVYLTSGTALRSWHDYSFAVRNVIKHGGKWVAYGTVFKFPTGEEYSTLYVDSTGGSDPETATWRPARKTDTPLINFLPYFTPYQHSDENPGFVWGELTSTAHERLSPDAIITSSGFNVSGGIAYIQDDPDAPDANWFTHTADTGILRVSFPTPTGGNPITGAGIQEFRLWLRKEASGGGNPTFSAELRETGGSTALQTLATAQSVTSNTGQLFLLAWNAANLATANGSAVELYLTTASDGGGPNKRRVEIGAVEWNAQVAAAATTNTATVSIDALLQKTAITQAVSLGALLQKSFSSTASLDSLLQQQGLTATANVDAILQAVISGQVSLDSLIQSGQSIQVSIDSLLQSQAVSAAAVLDALIRDTLTASLSLDSVLTGSNTASIVLDSLIQSGKLSITDIDAAIQAQGVSVSAVLDGLIRSTRSSVTSLDAVITGGNTASVVLDSLIQSGKLSTASLDAVLQASGMSATAALDALIQRGNVSATTAIDALIQSGVLATTSIDALLAQNNVVASAVLDALLQSQSLTATAVIDAVILATKSSAVSLDAVLTGAAGTNASTSLHAFIQAAKTAGTSLDGAIQSQGELVTAVLDAYVQATRQATVSLGALLQSSGVTAVTSLDALLRADGLTATISIDSMIMRAQSANADIDAIIAVMRSSSVLLDSILLGTRTATLSLDAVIGIITRNIARGGFSNQTQRHGFASRTRALGFRKLN